MLPESLIEAGVGMRELLDWQPPVLNQQAMVRFIGAGHLDRHLRRSRKAYRPRHQLVSEFVRHEAAAGRLQAVADNHAGLHIAVHLPDGVSDVDVRARANAAGVALGDYRISWVDPDCAPHGLVIGFGCIRTDDLPQALSIVSGAL